MALLSKKAVLVKLFFGPEIASYGFLNLISKDFSRNLAQETVLQKNLTQEFHVSSFP